MRVLSILKGFVVGLWAISPKVAAQPTTKAFTVIYDGWGTPARFTVSGRVLEDQGESAPAKETGAAQNLVDNMKALESDEIANADLKITVGGAVYTATTDQDGMFTLDVKGLPEPQRLALGEAKVSVEVVKPANVHAPIASGRVFVLDDTKPFVAVISDVDDTIVKTHVTDKRKLLGAVLLSNAAQLEPVDGAAKNYVKAREAGAAVFFYVSGSPQNFHRRITSYIAGNGFPQGPLVLKNLGADNPLKQEGYKGSRIDMLMEAFPLMRVVCVGDSGEHDPEIYAAARTRHPGRVRAIVIRKAPGSNVTPERFDGMTAIDDKYPSDDVVAKLVGEAIASLGAPASAAR
jgi:phosphatidate phosphatase APP1